MNILILMLMTVLICGCSWPFQHYTESNNEIHCTQFLLSDAPPTCTVYDPIIKKQTVLDPNYGEITECKNIINICYEFIRSYKCITCQTTYTDSLKNTWKGKEFTEEVTPT